MRRLKKTLWTKNFTLVTAASALGAVGGIAGGFALSFLVFDETGSTLASALILAIQLVPFFVLPLFLAPVMDRLPRKPFLVAGDLIDGVLYALMGLYLLKFEFSYAAYLGYSLLLACLESFDELAFQSIYPKLIPEGMEQQGYAVSTTLYPILRVLMLPLAGVLLDAVGAAWILIGQGGLSLLASSNPVGTIFSALFISYIQVGGAAMQPAYSSETIDIVIAVIIYLAAFALLMRGVIAKAVSGRKEKGGAAK